MFKFCYIDLNADFIHARTDMEDLESKYPDQVFVWWTMPLKTTGDADRDNYNKLVRDYCKSNNKILFDIADIESYDPSGNPQTKGGYEAMYSFYSTDGGHLNSTGYLRIAKAFWYLALLVSKH